MARDAIVPEEFAKKFATEKDTPYARWVRSEGLDIIGAHYVANLRTVALKPWARRGGSGVYLNHDASRTSNDCYVCEIPAGAKLAPQRQLFEEMIYVLTGLGSTTVWNDAGQRITFEWKAGSLFAIPLNAWHQHFNGSGREPARYVAVTNGPAVINLYEDVEFVFNTKYDFKNRFSGEPDYFSNKGEQKGLLLQTNFVSDAVNLPLISAKERGAGGGHIRFNMARGSMNSHISQFPIGTYKKAHAHGPGAGRRAATLRLAGRNDDRAAEHVVPPAFQYGHGARALSGVQARSHVHSERTRGSQSLDQQAHGRRPDRLRGRKAGDSQAVYGGARQARLEATDGGGVQGGTGRIDFQSGLIAGSGVARNFPAQSAADDCSAESFEQELTESLVWRAKFR